MADAKKVSELPVVTSVTTSDNFYVVQTGTSKRCSAYQIAEYVLRGCNVGVYTTAVSQFGNGSVSAPSITNYTDSNTGIWFPTADTLAVSTGGSERLRINSSGNLGLGTTSPTNKLHIDTTNFAEHILLKSSADTSRGYAFGITTGANFRIYDTVDGTRLTITSAGNVLIGTSSDDASNKLQIIAATNDTGIMLRCTALNSNYGGSLRFGGIDNDNNNVDFAKIKLGIDTGAVGGHGGYLALYTSTGGAIAEKARLTGSGKLLLATATTVTGATLEVNGSVSAVLATSASGLPAGTFWNDNGTVKIVQ